MQPSSFYIQHIVIRFFWLSRVHPHVPVNTKGMVEKDLLPAASHESRERFWRWQLLFFSASPRNDFETKTSEQGSLVTYYIFNLATWVLTIPKSLQKKKSIKPNPTATWRLKRVTGVVICWGRELSPRKWWYPQCSQQTKISVLPRLLLNLILEHGSGLSKVPANHLKYQPWTCLKIV